ncbi:hypothetical protein BGY98DRAFT_1189092 [Russula aff. rugulosa BPL654]|nr:hypothetical protein BGY98DRAFT_1189092 [Russula aff. rugulosa BPL654]
MKSFIIQGSIALITLALTLTPSANAAIAPDRLGFVRAAVPTAMATGVANESAPTMDTASTSTTDIPFLLRHPLFGVEFCRGSDPKHVTCGFGPFTTAVSTPTAAADTASASTTDTVTASAPTADTASASTTANPSLGTAGAFSGFGGPGPGSTPTMDTASASTTSIPFLLRHPLFGVGFCRGSDPDHVTCGFGPFTSTVSTPTAAADTASASTTDTVTASAPTADTASASTTANPSFGTACAFGGFGGLGPELAPTTDTATASASIGAPATASASETTQVTPVQVVAY